MKVISTNYAPGAIGPYSQGYVSGNLVFTSGQIGIDPSTGELVSGVVSQAHQACKNVAAVLSTGGADMTTVIKTTCFLADMADFNEFNAVYARYFTSSPARSCVAVKALPKGALCEIEAIAEVK